MLFCVSIILKARLENLYEKKTYHDLCGQFAGVRSGTRFFVKEWAEGRYMTGPGDGLAQMIVFKKLLFDQYTHGNFFYNYSFGLGGGTFSQLGYYFSASFLFLAVSAAVWLLQAVQLIGEADTLFGQSQLFLSVFSN